MKIFCWRYRISVASVADSDCVNCQRQPGALCTRSDYLADMNTPEHNWIDAPNMDNFICINEEIQHPLVIYAASNKH